MDCCKDCRFNNVRIRDSRRLYFPSLRKDASDLFSGAKNKTMNYLAMSRSGKRCSVASNPTLNDNNKYLIEQAIPNYCGSNCNSTCGENIKYKQYWRNNCKIPCVNLYEEQPWFKDPIIQEGWGDFISDYVTPTNISCHLTPKPHDCNFQYNKVRSFRSPRVACTWDLPCPEESCPTRYVYNRDWRRYNESERFRRADADIDCNCFTENVFDSCCDPNKSDKGKCDVWAPYLGQAYGARYMAWAHPLSFHYLRPRPFHY